MNDSEKPKQGRDASEQPRREYEPPEIVELGTLEQLTRGRAIPGLRDSLGGSLPG